MSLTDVAPSGPRLAFGAATDVGLKRSVNEDSYLAHYPVFVVADGMGGHGHGDLASAAAISAVAELAGQSDVSVEDARVAISGAQSRVAALADGSSLAAGTTLSGSVVVEQGGNYYWLVVNIGDSRTYRLSEGRLEQISIDHSEVQERLASGELTPEQAAHYPRRNVVTRALGAGGHFEPEYWLVPLLEWDRLLVCSDGLSGEVSDDGILAILLSQPHPQAAADELIRAALAGGGRDNVTAVIVDALGTGEDHSVDATNSTPELHDGDGNEEDTIPRGIATLNAMMGGA